jgi:GGDEF domain-containing protein
LYLRRGLFRAKPDVFSGVFVLLELERFKDFKLNRGYQRTDELLALVAQAFAGACSASCCGNCTACFCIMSS